MNELVMALMVWLGPVLGLPVPDHGPTIRLLPHCQIQEVAYEGTTHGCTDDGVQAIYMHENDTILMPDTFNVRDLGDVSMLLHETVHFMQDQVGQNAGNAACLGELERVAYQAQIRWLEAAGVDAFKVMQLDRLSMYLITQCGQPWEHARPPRQ